jgi:hypothetical protein
MRLALYGGVSTLLATAVIIEAFRQRSNFYTACIYLAKSSACMLVRTISRWLALRPGFTDLTLSNSTITITDAFLRLSSMLVFSYQLC